MLAWALVASSGAIPRSAQPGAVPSAANRGSKALAVIASLLSGGDCIDRVNVLRAVRTQRTPSVSGPHGSARPRYRAVETNASTGVIACSPNTNAGDQPTPARRRLPPVG